MSQYRFAVRDRSTGEFFGTVAFDGIPADKPGVAEARLFDEIDMATDPYGAEFVRLRRNWCTGSRMWEPEGDWQQFTKGSYEYRLEAQQ